MLQSSLQDPDSWMGALMRNADMVLPERHLGLTIASELPDAMARLDAAADALSCTPLGRMTLDDLQRWAVDFSVPEVTAFVAPGAPVAGRSAPCPPAALRPPPLPSQNALPPAPPPLFGKTIAVARDAAFCFIYTANLDCLSELGAELVFFSPLADTALPPCDAVWIPGGYPELHADIIAANSALRGSLAKHIAAGKPVWAECGGMMALFDTLVSVDGQRHAQWGLLSGEVTMHKRLAGLGPQQLTLDSGTVRGHTFHYSTTHTPLQAVARTSRPDTAPQPDAGEALWQQGALRASYFHAWFPSCPAAVVELFSAVHSEETA
jgi:cobyrinic acid a,c-diamide synthase